MESNSGFNYTSDKQIRLLLRGRPIVLSQTELEDTKSYDQLIIKVTISEERRIAKL